MELEEQHQADRWGKGLVLVGPTLVFLGPGVVTLSDHLEGLGSLVIEATRDQGVLGLEGGLAVGTPEVVEPIAGRNRELAVGRGKRELADEAVGVTELTVAAHTNTLNRAAAGHRIPTTHAVELQGGANALPVVTGSREGESGLAKAEPTAGAYR